MATDIHFRSAPYTVAYGNAFISCVELACLNNVLKTDLKHLIKASNISLNPGAV